jgi:RNA recognition motif-containing protein
VRLFVSNIAFQASEGDLRELFTKGGYAPEPGGDDVKIILDRDTGESRGFGFIELSDELGEIATIQAMDGTHFMGRRINVRRADPKQPRADAGNRGRRSRRSSERKI